MVSLYAVIVIFVTYHLINFTRVLILHRGTINDMEPRKVKIAREQLDTLAQTLPGVNNYARCPVWVEKPSDQYTKEEWDLFCRGGQKDLLRVIMHLNDHHHWTREQIADFVQEQHDAGNIDVSFETKLFANRKV